MSPRPTMTTEQVIADRYARAAHIVETTTTPAPLTTSETHALASDLLQLLAPRIGDQRAIDHAMLRWLDNLGARNLGLVTIAAVRRTFVDCLQPINPTNPPDSGIGFQPEGEHQ